MVIATGVRTREPEGTFPSGEEIPSPPAITLLIQAVRLANCNPAQLQALGSVPSAKPLQIVWSTEEAFAPPLRTTPLTTMVGSTRIAEVSRLLISASNIKL